jgi:hypothetical protein
MRRLAIVLASGVAIATLALACGSSRIPTPPYAQQTTSALTEVPYPPPPARVEKVPKRPDDRAVWIDGEWTWQGRRWAWRQGRWVDPPEDGVFSPWATVRDASGTLYVAAGTWCTREGATLPDPPPIVAGRPTTGAMVNPEGEAVGPAPIAPADAGPVIVDSGPPTVEDAGPKDAAMPDVGLRDALPTTEEP